MSEKEDTTCINAEVWNETLENLRHVTEDQASAIKDLKDDMAQTCAKSIENFGKICQDTTRKDLEDLR